MRRAKKDPFGESIVTTVIASAISDFISGIINEIVVPKIKRLCGEKDVEVCSGEGDCLPSCKESK